MSQRIKELTAVQPKVELERRPIEFGSQEERLDLLETLVANLPFGITILETDSGRVIYMNQECERVYGWPADKLSSAPDIFDRTVPDLGKRIEIYERIAEAFARLEPDQLRWEDVDILTSDGEVRTITSKNIPLEKWGLTITVVMELSRRRELLAALSASEHRYREMVETVPFAVVILDTDMRITAWNSAAERIFGWTRQEVVGKAPYEFMMPDYSKQNTTDALQSMLAVAGGNERINENLCKDGTVITCRWKNKSLLDEHGRIVAILSTAEDITEQIQLEEQFRQAQKMEAIGRLAGGIAHDFNNLLTTILGYSEMLLLEDSSNPSFRECAEGISQSAHRAAAMTQQLLSFSRKQSLVLKAHDINALIRGTTEMLRRLIGEDITLHLDLCEKGCTVKIDSGQFEQVIMNLVVNSRDAMPNGGTLTISTERKHLGGGSVGSPREPGWYIVMRVSDTGQGMDEETALHLFEPFFTTKGPGEGTGLGLSTVFGIVSQCHGWIDVNSKPGEGATFTICLPVEDAETENKPEANQSSALEQGTETILLVEDEDTLIRMFVRILERLNYRVIEARNGEDAMKVIESRADIDLLVTDVVMPKMGGTDLASRAYEVNPKIRILFMSGYTEDEVFPPSIPENERFLLVKPFTAAQLAEKIRTILDS